MRRSQSNRILSWLSRGHSLTAQQALESFGTMRLAARINDLRREGHSIQSTTIVRGGKRVASYTMVPPPVQQATFPGMERRAP